MAFMLPLMKNNYDIYKDNRSRKTSEGSNSNTDASDSANVPLRTAMSAPGSARRPRKVSECKSESFALPPAHNSRQAISVNRIQRCQSTRTFPRNASRNSNSSLMSPTRSFCVTKSSNPEQPSSTSLSMTATATATAVATSSSSGASTSNKNNSGNGQNDLSIFHSRLIEKLRKSFRKEKADRS